MAEAGDVSVGRLVVELTGDASELDSTLVGAVAHTKGLEDATKRTNEALDTLSDHEIGNILMGIKLYQDEINRAEKKTQELNRILSGNYTKSSEPSSSFSGKEEKEIQNALLRNYEQVVQRQNKLAKEAEQAKLEALMEEAEQEKEIQNNLLRSYEQVVQRQNKLAKEAKQVKLEEAEQEKEIQNNLLRSYEQVVQRQTRIAKEQEKERIEAARRQAAIDDDLFESFINHEREKAKATKDQTEIAQRVEEQHRKDSNELEQTKIETTMTGHAKELALMAHRHQVERAERQRLGQDTTLFDQTAQMQQDALQKKHDEEGKEHGHMSHMLVRRIAFHAGQAMGATGIGNDVTGLMAVFQGMAPLAATGTVALVAMGMVIKNIQERAAEVRKEQIEYNEELRVSSKHWLAITASQYLSNELTKTGLEESLKAGEVLQKIRAEHEEKTMAFEHRALGVLPSFDKITDKVEAVGQYIASGSKSTTTNYDVGEELRERQIEEARNSQKRMEEIALDEMRVQLLVNNSNREAAVESATIANLFEGPAKKRIELEQKISDENRKRYDSDNQKMRLQDVSENEALEKAKTRIEETKKALEAYDATVAPQMQKGEERTRLVRERMRAIEDYNKTKEQHEKIKGMGWEESDSEDVAQAIIHEKQRQGLLLQQQEEWYKEVTAGRNKFQEAHIRATTTGDAQEKALVKQKTKEQIEEQQHGISVSAEQARKAKEKQLADVKKAQEEYDSLIEQHSIEQEADRMLLDATPDEKEKKKIKDRMLAREDNESRAENNLENLKAGKDAENAANNAAEIKKRGVERIKQIEDTAQEEERSQIRKHTESLMSIYEGYEESKVRLTMVGMAQTRALRELANQKELHEFDIAHPSDDAQNRLARQALLGRQQNDRGAAERDIQLPVTEKLADIANHILVTNRLMTESAAIWASTEREMKKAGNTLQQIAATEKAMADQANAAAARPLQDAMLDARIRETHLKLGSGQLIHQDEILERLTREHPEIAQSNPWMLQGLARQEERNSAMQMFKGALEHLHPAYQLQSYAKDLKEAWMTGAIKKKDADDLYREKQFEVLGHMDSGTFNDKYTRGQVNLSAINLNSQFSQDKSVDFLRSIDGKMGEFVNGQLR